MTFRSAASFSDFPLKLIHAWRGLNKKSIKKRKKNERLFHRMSQYPHNITYKMIRKGKESERRLTQDRRSGEMIPFRKTPADKKNITKWIKLRKASMILILIYPEAVIFPVFGQEKTDHCPADVREMRNATHTSAESQIQGNHNNSR